MTGILSQLLLGRGTSTRLARGVLGAATLVAGGDVEEDNFDRHGEGLQYWPHRGSGQRRRVLGSKWSERLKVRRSFCRRQYPRLKTSQYECSQYSE